MLCEELDIPQGCEDLLYCKAPQHSFDEYLRQYMTALCFLVNKTDRQALNSKCLSVLFIFRHTVELFLKRHIPEPIYSHSLSTLYSKAKLEKLSPQFKDILPLLDGDKDGTCFRYIQSTNGVEYNFDPTPGTSYLSAFQCFFSLMGKTVENVSTKRDKSYFELHPERDSLGQVKTDYDFSITQLVKGILTRRLKTDDVLLPLLFLLRHSLELSLKSNLQEVFGKVYNNEISKEHSLCKLFSYFNKEISKGIEQMPEKDELKKQTETYNDNLDQLQECINNLDDKSQAFRYPTDNQGLPFQLTIDKNFVIQVLQLFTDTDAYMSFAIPALQDYGYLPTEDESDII